MHLLFLSSVHPNAGHSQSIETVLGALIKACLRLGHKISWATAGPGEGANLTQQVEFAKQGAIYIGDFTENLDEDHPDGWRRKLWNLRKAIWSQARDDQPLFTQPAKVAEEIANVGADAIVLHWDTWFEHLIPYLVKVPLYGYWAKPRYDSAMTRLADDELRPKGLRLLKRWVYRRHLLLQQKRHFERATRLSGLSDICALDSDMYRAAGIDCHYISNTWPDAFGKGWCDRRKQAEDSIRRKGILGGLGELTATGNQYGISFWSRELLPRLAADKNLAVDWQINVCGRGFTDLPPAILSNLNSDLVQYKGFVDDIDQEMVSNAIFLMCNNAGPYTGGYTRVIYAMSAGACIVAHRNLALSMPEVRHNYNVLLGDTGKEIGDLLIQAMREPDLRSRVGRQARDTYEKSYCPEAVAQKIIDMVEATES